MSSQHEQEYWNEKHRVLCQGSPTKEWYCDFFAVQTFFEELGLTAEHSVLVLGPGWSKFPQALYHATECRDLTVADFSKSAISLLKEMNRHACAGIRYYTTDVSKGIDFPHFNFDAVIDRGVIDCLMCGEDGAAQVEELAKRIYAITNPECSFVVFSHASPPFRERLLRAAPWEDVTVKSGSGVDLDKVAEGIDPAVTVELKDIGSWGAMARPAFYLYTCRKPAAPPPKKLPDPEPSDPDLKYLVPKPDEGAPVDAAEAVADEEKRNEPTGGGRKDAKDSGNQET